MARAKTAELAARRAAERRAAERVLVDLEVDYRSEDTYLFASSKDLSETGIFIRAIEPLPPGTRLNLRFGQVELEGEVIWVNPYRPDALTNLDPGMGVRFIELGAPARRRLLELIRRIAYID